MMTEDADACAWPQPSPALPCPALVNLSAQKGRYICDGARHSDWLESALGEGPGPRSTACREETKLAAWWTLITKFEK